MSETESQYVANDTSDAVSTVTDTPFALPADELEAARALIVAANPGIVPELLSGSTIADLTASLTGAKAAYDRIATSVAATTGSAASVTTPSADTPPAVPGGGTGVVVLDSLPTSELLRRGVAANRARRG